MGGFRNGMHVGRKIWPCHKGLYLACIPLIDHLIVGIWVALIYLPRLFGPLGDILYSLFVWRYYPAFSTGLYGHVGYG